MSSLGRRWHQVLDGRPLDGPPPGLLLALEGQRAVTEFGAFLAASPWLQTAPRGEGRPVLVLPGFMADDSSTRVLRSFLRSRGYHVHGWRLGRNVGPSRQILDGMDSRLDALADAHGQPVSIVGWSLGGIFARELARRTPDSVRRVVTLGSPFRITSPDQSRASRLFDRYSYLHVDPAELPIFARDREAMAMPATAVYSRTDGVVAWQTCVDVAGPLAENVEVRGSHCGLGHNPAALFVVADRLAQPVGGWSPFRAPALLRRFYPSPVSAPPSAQAA